MIIGIAFLVVILDQVVKYIVQHSMELGQTIPLIPHVFHLTYSIRELRLGYWLIRAGYFSLLHWCCLLHSLCIEKEWK